LTAMLTFLLFATSQAQAPCVLWVIGNLTSQFGDSAATELTQCFQNTTYYYDAVTCSLMNSIPSYCEGNCRALMQSAISMSVELNCTEEVLGTVESTSSAICDPFSTPAKSCLPGSACVNLTAYGEGWACLPILPMAATTVNCSFLNGGMACSMCNMSASAMCNVDFTNPLVPNPVCVQAVYSTVNIFVDRLIDAYFYLYQTICQMSNTAPPNYCANLVYMVPEPTCSDVTSWGCCAGTYLDMVSACQNPATTLINDLHAGCSQNDWTTKCGGALLAANCCGKDTVCMSAAFGVAPSVLVLALLAVYALF